MYLPTLFTLDSALNWLFTSGLKVVLVLLAAWIGLKIFKAVVLKLLTRAIKQGVNGLRVKTGRPKVEEERLKTLQKVSLSIAKTVVWLLAVITILPEFGINIGPLLAGLGVAGLALGFGARSLIQDYISGLFILIEDQFRVGEEVLLDGTRGKVKSVNLRRTVLKDTEDVLHYLPNSQIKKASNFSRK